MDAMPSTAKIALITGANRGIGRSAALYLARDGVDTSHAAAEIRFFVRAWALGHPELRATVLG